MTILLTGGGSGGHITPLLAVARELKQLDPTLKLMSVCEKNGAFLHLFQNDSNIDASYEVRAGKFRRYAGRSTVQQLLDIETFARNTRDIGRVVRGYVEARRLLRRIKPDGILIKGGFVGVPVGLAAAHLGIPFITHDSDSTAGLANRIISKWALKHATGMPTKLYNYPKADTVYTGVPIQPEFVHVTDVLKKSYRTELGLQKCREVITIIGASQGGDQLNKDVVAIAGRLMQQHKGLGIVHISGALHEHEVQRAYDKELLTDERSRVVVKGFVSDVYKHTGAANVVVSRASATVIAELSVQGIATILVPGQLAGDHQRINARHLAEAGVALLSEYGDREGLYEAIHKLLSDSDQVTRLASGLHSLAKPHAARDLAELLLSTFTQNKTN